MSFLSALSPPHRKGEHHLQRGRAAEGRRDFDAAKDHFLKSAEAFDAHFTEAETEGRTVRPSHMVMAGIVYTRVGRNEDALSILDACLSQKEIPDAYLHAGYAAAKLGKADRALHYWMRYPTWADQRIIATTLKEQVAKIQQQGDSALQPACEAVVEAVFRQDKENTQNTFFARGKKDVPSRREY